jgi:predicted Zn-ribbon and HTH transcriptional regulator
MFSEELQRLIDASLVDGVITDKERAVIHKRALQEGVDPDEVDVMLDAEIEKMRQHQESAVKKVKKCPNCGEVIPSMAVKCRTCGYEFRDVEVSSSIRKLFDQLNAIEGQRKINIDERSIDEDSIVLKKRELIRSFPVPNTKEDIFEFLSLALPNAKKKGGILSSSIGRFLVGFAPCVFVASIMHFAGYDELITINIVLWGFVISGLFGEQGGATSMKLHNVYANDWKSKFEQILTKAKLSMGDDSTIKEINNRYKEQNKKELVKMFAGYAVAIILILSGILFVCFSRIGSFASENKDAVDKQYTELCKKIDDLGIPNIENYNTQKYELLKITWEPVNGGGKYEQEKKEQYLKKKRSYASQLDAFHQEHYKEIGDNSMYEQIDEIRFPLSYINN